MDITLEHNRQRQFRRAVYAVLIGLALLFVALLTWSCQTQHGN